MSIDENPDHYVRSSPIRPGKKKLTLTLDRALRQIGHDMQMDYWFYLILTW